MENKVPCSVCTEVSGRVAFRKNEHTLYRCHECQFLYVYPIPAELNEVYGESYFHKDTMTKGLGYSEYDADKEPMRDFFVGELERLESLHDGRSIFDVGTATGFFLDRAKERGWQTHGVEISSFAGREAQVRGHQIHIGVIEDIPNAHYADVVTMWDVLEHVAEVQSTIMATYRVLKPGGSLVINTPDVGSVFARIMGRRWHLIVPPEHLNYFSRQAITRLLNNAGFVDITITSKAKKFSLSYIFQILYRWHGIRLWGTLSRYFDTPFWRKIALPINLYDNMLVTAKKKHGYH